MKNVDKKVVEDFGKEWQVFNHKELPESELSNSFYQYFDIFPFEKLNETSVGFDMGCGSGRWAKLMAPKVGRLNCIDPSEAALNSARENLEMFTNCTFECASVSDSQLKDLSQDFGYCLGVLHHIPNTFEGLQACAQKLKPGAPFLLYLYYRFDGKPFYFKALWKLSDYFRKIVCHLPFKVKYFISEIIALVIYLPLSRTSLLLEKMGIDVLNVPLSYYRHKPFYSLRTDALDRFGTRIEKRFTKPEITQMLVETGFGDIKYSDSVPYWVVVSTKI